MTRAADICSVEGTGEEAVRAEHILETPQQGSRKAGLASLALEITGLRYKTGPHPACRRAISWRGFACLSAVQPVAILAWLDYVLTSDLRFCSGRNSNGYRQDA